MSSFQPFDPAILVGLDKSAAARVLKDRPWRVVREDSSRPRLPPGVVAGRVNLEIENGRVVSARVERR